MQATGDGTFKSPKATVRRAGFYAFRERIVGTETVAGFQGECALEAETSLVAPLILGGRGDVVRHVVAVRAAAAEARAAGAARRRRAGLTRSASTRSPARSASRRTSAGSAGGATAPRPATTRAPS